MPVLVLPRHLHSVPYLGRVGYCSRGARAWFSANGLDWARFVAEGLPAEEFERTGDPLAVALAEHARKDNADG